MGEVKKDLKLYDLKEIFERITPSLVMDMFHHIYKLRTMRMIWIPL